MSEEILFIVFCSLNIILEIVFIAYRSSKFAFIKNTIFSMVKLDLPISLVALGACDMVVSTGIAMAIAFLVSLVFLILRFDYSPKPIMDLPILITNSIGAKFLADFYLDMMIVSLLYITPMVTSQSLFAESSYNGIKLKCI